MTIVQSVPTNAGYPMQRWVFQGTPGRFDIDLSSSYVRTGRLSELTVPEGLVLSYGADRGIEELRTAIAGLYGGSADSVLVTHGAEEALFLLYCTLLAPGDQVITFRPGWQQSWDAPAMLGCQVDVLDLAPDFSIDPNQVTATATSALRMIIVNSPGNPTGRRMLAAELAGLAAVAERHDAYLVLDQEYELDLADCGVARSDRVVSVSGLSKVFGFAGLRIGWMYGTPEVVDRCADRKHLTTISNSVLCEVLACEVLSRRDSYVAEYDCRVQAGLEIARRWADRNAGRIRLMQPDRTPFAWVYLDTGEPSLSFCRRVLDERVLLMPAETLGGSGGFRLGLSPASEGQLTAGLARIDYVWGNSTRKMEFTPHEHACRLGTCRRPKRAGI